MGLGNPVDRGLDLAAIGRGAAPRGRIIRAVKFNNAAVNGILRDADAGDVVSVPKPYFASRRQTVIFFRRLLLEIILLDVNDA